MNAPQSRICFYPVDGNPDALEILMLGDPDEIAIKHTELRRAIEAWPGFHSVRPLVMSGCVLGYSVMLSIRAEHNDTIAEAMRMLTRSQMQLGNIAIGSERCGAIARW